MVWGQVAGQAPSLPKGTTKWIEVEGEPITASDGSLIPGVLYQNIATGEKVANRPAGEILSVVGNLRNQPSGVYGQVYKDSAGTLYGTNAEVGGFGKPAGKPVLTLSGPNADKMPDGTQWTSEMVQKQMAGTQVADQQSNADTDQLGEYLPYIMAAIATAGATGMLGGASGAAGTAGAGLSDAAISAGLNSTIGGASGLGMTAAEAGALGLGAGSVAGGGAPVVDLSAAFNTVPTGSAVPPGLVTEAMRAGKGLSSLTQAPASVSDASAPFNTVPTGSATPPGLTTEAMKEAGLAATAANAASGAKTAGAGLTNAAGGTGALTTVTDGLRTAGTLAGAVTAVNSVLGDPLNLNKGSDAADAANKAASEASGASADYQRQMADIARQQWEFYKTNYQPVELDLIRQAKEAGSQEEFARARGAANADVTGSFDRARKEILRDTQSRGINPASGAAQSTEGSIRLAEGASRAGALTGADNLTRNLMWSKGLDVANLGRNIPGQSSATLGNAGSIANQSSRVNSLNAQGQQDQGDNIIQNMGYGLNTIADSIDKYGPTVKKWFGYKKGGRVIEGESKRIFGPHMRRYAMGGGVEEEGLQPRGMAMQDASQMGMMVGPGNETSDSIPAVVDGQEPAALSTNEFVMNAEVPKMTGEEILDAINQAGLAKRQGAGLEPREERGEYAEGGPVNQDQGLAESMRVSPETQAARNDDRLRILLQELDKNPDDANLKATIKREVMRRNGGDPFAKLARKTFANGGGIGFDQGYARGGQINRRAGAGL